MIKKTLYTQSSVLIIPAARRPDMEKIYDAMGLGDDNFTVALSPTGRKPITHYATIAREKMTDIFERVAARGGNIPDRDWGSKGLNNAKVRAAFAQLTHETQATDAGETPREQFYRVLAFRNLKNLTLYEEFEA